MEDPGDPGLSVTERMTRSAAVTETSETAPSPVWSLPFLPRKAQTTLTQILLCALCPSNVDPGLRSPAHDDTGAGTCWTPRTSGVLLPLCPCSRPHFPGQPLGLSRADMCHRTPLLAPWTPAWPVFA